MTNIINKFNSTGNGDKNNPKTIPCIRIPLTADYWLYGSTKSASINSNNDTEPQKNKYYIPGQNNVCFTGEQYQNAILEMIYYCYTSWNTNAISSSNNNIPMTFILDLHWNYPDSNAPQTSYSYYKNSTINSIYNNPMGISSKSKTQLSMTGVASADITTFGLTDNTIEFWNSVSTLVGVKNDGSETKTTSVKIYKDASSTSVFQPDGSLNMPIELKRNIFFELYNEPHTEDINDENTFNNNYKYYINGGTNLNSIVTGGNADCNFTGMGQIYNEIRSKVQNICVISGSDNYAYMNFTGDDQLTDNNINRNKGNCFTYLKAAVKNGTIPKQPSNINVNYSAISFNNVMLNLHPYAGLFCGVSKHPGYYSNNKIGFAQILEALQAIDTSFGMSNPIICTEFGQYNLPWGNYSETSVNVSSNFAYKVDGGGVVITNFQETYAVPYYDGYYTDSSGVLTPMPAIVGYLKDFKKHNVSFTAWAVRPNGGGTGLVYNNNDISNKTNDYPNYFISNSNPTYLQCQLANCGWGATQPDVTTGSWCSYSDASQGIYNINSTSNYYMDPSLNNNSLFKYSTINNINNINNINTYITPKSLYSLKLIGSSNQTAYYASSNNVNGLTYVNGGNNGPDFQWIFENYYNK